jgi:hypothetical protein
VSVGRPHRLVSGPTELDQRAFGRAQA